MAFDPADYDVKSFLSAPRFATYQYKTSFQDEKASRLYFWNQELAGTFLGPLSVLEIALRNSIHSHLSAHFGEEWITDASACDLLDEDREGFEKTIDRLENMGKDISPDAVVAASSFGDWVRLLGDGQPRNSIYNYEKTLWVPALKEAFPKRGKIERKEIHGRLNHLRSFRNRVVHHEPIFKRNLKLMMSDIVTVTRMINDDAATIVELGNRLDEVLNAKSDALAGSCLI
jgi:hypothetical protein